MKYICCYTCIDYDTAGAVNGVYSDCFTVRAYSKEEAEDQARGIAVRFNPGRRVFIVIAKKA